MERLVYELSLHYCSYQMDCKEVKKAEEMVRIIKCINEKKYLWDTKMGR